jgi:drug/metabolite transporter (DMT)-like permease
MHTARRSDPALAALHDESSRRSGAVPGGCLGLARCGHRRLRPVWLALACGAGFGVTAFLLKLVPDTLAQGFSDPMRQWPLYLPVIIGPTGFLLNQNAFQAGLLIAPMLAIITTVDPLTSIAIAHLWLGERIASTPPTWPPRPPHWPS